MIHKECITLNDSAVSLLNKYHIEDGDPAMLDMALRLLDEAIDCDTSYYLAYNNKVTVLSSKGEYKEVINLLNKMFEFSNNPQLLFFKGIAYEKLNDYSSSKIVYKQAATVYEKSLKLYPDSVEIIIEKLFFTAFTKGNDNAIAELKEYISKYPDNTMLKEYETVFKTFDRNDWMTKYGK